ncbi:MAG TPA: hypothetical protein VF256_23585, partial [Streptosporangiaceae bacterium]
IYIAVGPGGLWVVDFTSGGLLHLRTVSWSRLPGRRGTSLMRRELPTEPLEPGDALTLMVDAAFERGVAPELWMRDRRRTAVMPDLDLPPVPLVLPEAFPVPGGPAGEQAPGAGRVRRLAASGYRVVLWDYGGSEPPGELTGWQSGCVRRARPASC